MNRSVLFFFVVGMISAVRVSAGPVQKSAPVSVSPNAPLINRQNLISLEFYTVGGLPGPPFSDTLLVHPNGSYVLDDSRSTLRLPPDFKIARQLSAAQIKKLYALINQADFPALKPQYRDERIMDAGVAIVTLTFRDRFGHRKVFRVSDSGRTAPEGFNKLTQYLWMIDYYAIPKSRKLY